MAGRAFCTPYNGLYGEAPLKRGTFSRARAYAKGRNLGREVCHFGLFKGTEWLADEFYGCEKVEETFGFFICSYLKDCAFTAVKREAKF